MSSNANELKELFEKTRQSLDLDIQAKDGEDAIAAIRGHIIEKTKTLINALKEAENIGEEKLSLNAHNVTDPHGNVIGGFKSLTLQFSNKEAKVDMKVDMKDFYIGVQEDPLKPPHPR